MIDPQAGGLAELAQALADRTRAAVLLALLDGRAWTPGELARLTGVAPSTMSGHLARLTEAGLVAHTAQGRHRYVRVAGSEVAELVETLSSRLDRPLPPVTSLRTANRRRALAVARTCYDHLAGRLGVAVTSALVRTGRVDHTAGRPPVLTGAGEEWFAALGADLDAMATARRPLLRECLDWTERLPHLAGTAAAYLRTVAAERGWVVPVTGTRALRVTPEGEAALREHLGIGPGELTLT
ncbi:transcriptional regulator [Actinorhabdospora filicis]|uniref:Transcriptional regulator n=1 Tax=Actinorhabdospora filicis TaxID=1785913 RepID=A0A9W6SH18_9ACTN|nr:winged helix-turn-helix domain-containing protein [Actinorhabdospora filicis]GLZ75286.1 transcriptional regulator [Actinorhabdospora filicis]